MNVLCTKVKNTVDMHGKHVFSFVTPCRERLYNISKNQQPKYKMTSGCFFDLELSAKCKQVEWEFTAFCMACKHMFAYVCFICLYVCLPCSGGYSYFPGCSGLSHIRLSSHTHTNTSDLTIHSTVIYRCDPSLSCFIMATVGDIIHK